uniref:EH domain-containing protein n=1 Tax=Anabas testudineus TaxID=64144 RepID=A0AAQ6IPJ9_ANATE
MNISLPFLRYINITVFVFVSAGMVPMQQQQQQQQQGFPMVSVMQPNMQGMMGNELWGANAGMAIGMQTSGMQFLGQPQFMGMRPAGPQYTADLQKQMAEEHQKRLEQQQKMLEEDRKRRQFEEQKQKLRLLSSVKPKTGEKSRDDALEAIKGNLDGFSRDAKMHPTPSSQTKKPDSSPSHPSVTTHSLPPALSEDNDEFSDFQGPVDAPSIFPSSSSSTFSLSSQVHIQPSSPAPKTGFPEDDDEFSDFVQGPVNAFPSSNFHFSSQAQVQASFPSSQPLPQSLPASVSIPTATQHSAVNTSSQSTLQAGVGVYPQQEHIQPILPAWVYNDSLVPEMFKKVLEFTMTPAGIDTAKLYPILMSSGLPREALGQIWASANRTTPGMLTKEELYTVLALIGVAQSGLPALNVEILSQFPSPPVPNLPALAMTMAPVMPQHQQPMMTQPPVSMAMPTPAPPVMAMAPAALAQPTANTNFIASFPPAQVMHPCLQFLLDTFINYSLWFIGEGFADFKSVSADDGFTDFKTADSVSPLDPSEQAKIFQPSFPSPAASLSQPKNSLNMADLDLFSSMAPSVSAPPETKPSTFPSVSVPPSLVLLPGGAKPPGAGADDFGDFALFGSSSEVAQASTAGGAAAAPQDDFADFMAFGTSGGEPKGESSVRAEGETSTQVRPQQGSDKYDVFKQLSLEGGLIYDDNKESGGGSFSSLKSDTDDFADFQSSKFCTALGASEKTLVDKVSAFKQAKEDSASVKSLDLPSIGGSSVGKDDSEDALSVQLDMKLSDMGGDLKHVMSDSSLDLPGLSAHQPPATADDMKFDPFGTSALSTLPSYGWTDREECLPSEVRKSQVLEGASLPSLAPAQRKELTFGSTENITGSSVAKIPISSAADDKFEAFADFGSGDRGGVDDEDDFGDFASTVSEKSDSPSAAAEAASEGNQCEACDEFGAVQLDKPKFGKSDFLKASTQAKVKSSEEMIKNELATFDLSVQGSHKRSHSLGEKEIGRSPPSPAPEQPFRDRSNTLSEKPTLPVIRDKYKDLTGEVEESERYAYEWQRCLESALEVITKANNTLNSISSSSVCTEVIQSAQGMEYLLGVVEVYRVTRRVELGIKATAVCSEKLQQLLKDISRVWNNLMGFMSLAKLAPDESSLDFSSCILRHGIKNAKELACGVCLLNVEARSKVCALAFPAFNSETDNFKLLYGGHQYHASCANFWINCVEPKPPGLILPDLL